MKCHECGRQFVKQPTKKVIDQATRETIDQQFHGFQHREQAKPILGSLCDRQMTTFHHIEWLVSLFFDFTCTSRATLAYF